MLARLLETKVVVSGLVFGTLCYRRDALTASVILAAIANALLSKVLKYVINAARPAGAALADPGMPSSHAQSLFFFAMYLACGAISWPAPSETLNHTTMRRVAAVAIIAVAALLTLLRVKSGLHTMAQIGVGGAIGATNGAIFFWVSPSVERVLIAATPSSLATHLVFALLVLGALVVGSVERTVASKLKKQ